MLDTPKVMNVPGFDQPLREQTLAEFVMVLDENHLVRRELRELQRRSAQAAQLSAENQELKALIASHDDKVVDELLSAPATVAEMPKPISAPPPAAPAPYDYEKARLLTPSKEMKLPCRFCGKPIAKGKPYWTMHLKKAHPQRSPIDYEQEGEPIKS